MKMHFHLDLSETILFENWRTTEWEGILGSMVGIVLMAAIYEGLKNYREYLFVSASVAYQSSGKGGKKPSLVSGLHLFQTLLQMVQIIISYFLMLIFMTYNFWLCMAVTLGGGLGYWLFAWKKASTDITECCH